MEIAWAVTVLWGVCGCEGGAVDYSFFVGEGVEKGAVWSRVAVEVLCIAAVFLEGLVTAGVS